MAASTASSAPPRTPLSAESRGIGGRDSGCAVQAGDERAHGEALLAR
jgi:hypothetical protein